MTLKTEYSLNLSAVVLTDLDYAYRVLLGEDEISVNLIDSEDANLIGTVTFGSVDEMRTVAEAMLKLANTVDPK